MRYWHFYRRVGREKTHLSIESSPGNFPRPRLAKGIDGCEAWFGLELSDGNSDPVISVVAYWTWPRRLVEWWYGPF